MRRDRPCGPSRRLLQCYAVSAESPTAVEKAGDAVLDRELELFQPRDLKRVGSLAMAGKAQRLVQLLVAFH